MCNYKINTRDTMYNIMTILNTDVHKKVVKRVNPETSHYKNIFSSFSVPFYCICMR